VTNKGYVTADYVTNKGYVTADYVTNKGYVTADYVTNKGYVTADYVTNKGYVTADYVTNKGYITADYVTTQGYVVGNTGNITLGNNTGTIQLNGTTKCSSTVEAQTFNAISDRRLKSNIVDLDRDTSLKTLRELKPKVYDFKDSYPNQLGFIAQEIKGLDILSPAVNTGRGFIPNIARTVSCDCGVFTVEVPLKVSDRIQYKEGERMNVTTIIQSDNGVYQMETPITGDIYLYGTEIEDLHSIQKDMIYTLAVSALQRLDEIVTNQQKTIDFLLQRMDPRI
jgi:hypothetical protein